MQNTKKILCALLLLIPISIFAKTGKVTIYCHNALTQGDLNYCAYQEYQQQDKLLNDTYQKLYQSLQEKQRPLLLKAQRSWIQFRDHNCNFEASGVIGGSVWPMIYTNCLRAKTQQRIKELYNMGHCQEGVLSCPGPVSQ